MYTFGETDEKRNTLIPGIEERSQIILDDAFSIFEANAWI